MFDDEFSVGSGRAGRGNKDFIFLGRALVGSEAFGVNFTAS